MKKFRAIMSVFLAVALVLSAVPAFPVAAEADENLPKATSVTIENVEIYECTCGDYYEGNYSFNKHG